MASPTLHPVHGLKQAALDLDPRGHDDFGLRPGRVDLNVGGRLARVFDLLVDLGFHPLGLGGFLDLLNLLGGLLHLEVCGL